ncbi:MAG: amidohydrolase family protein [Acidobacteria bacterium]|nr:amidohydrolase family protein [Acidobacteriota bacterium]
MIIRNGWLSLPFCDEPVKSDVWIEEGRIAAIGQVPAVDDEILDADGCFILPGAVDAHVHFNEPGYTEREDFAHGSRAAVAGGVTTVIDMPCTSVPPVTTRANLQTKLAVIGGQSVCDFALFGGVSAQSFDPAFPDELIEMAPIVAGFKGYALSGMETFGRLDAFRLRELLSLSRSLNRPVLLHAEDADFVAAATPVFMAAGDSPRHYYLSRPETAEMLAVAAAVRLAGETGGNLHIVHIATGDALDLLAGTTVTGETCPHYLAFTTADFEARGAALKVAPTIKPAGNDTALWRALADGRLHFVTSDHAPCPEAGKRTGSIWSDYSGIAGTQTLLPYLFSEGYCRHRISWRRLAEITATAPARRYGLDYVKGTISPGKDADLVFIDPRASWHPGPEDMYSKGRNNPFLNRTWQGRIRRTMIRGRTVYTDTEGVTAAPGYGRFLKPRLEPCQESAR